MTKTAVVTGASSGIGAATAQALRGHGLEPDFVPERYTGKEMVKGLGEEALRGRRVLLPRTDIAPQELLGELALTRVLEATTAELGWLVHPHPTVSEMLKEAALAAEGQAIHI